MYQIVRTSPVHCSITDGIVGSRLKALPYAYNTLSYAKAKAGLLSHEDYINGGDDCFHVIKAGGPLSSRVGNTVQQPAFADEIPF